MGLWTGERVILLISCQHRGGRETCLGAPDPAKLPLQSWLYFKSNSKIQLSKLLIPSPKKPGTALGARRVYLLEQMGPSQLSVGCQLGWAWVGPDTQKLALALRGSSSARF